MWIISLWVLPLVSAFMWLAMLIAMLSVWAREGEPVYSNMSEGQTIAYISDIGAEGLKPLFIAGSVVTVVFLDLAFLSERWLRHAGQLLPNKGVFDKVCACISLFFALAGALGLILLSIFDTRHHPKMHDGFLIMFMVGYLISAIFICAEYLSIGILYRTQHRCFLVSFSIKVAFIIIEIALAIGFAVCMKHAEKRNASAILEWIIAFVFTGYVLSFVFDLLPSVRTRSHLPQGHGEKRGMDSEEFEHHHASLEQPLTHDSAGPNYYRGSRV